VGGNLHVHNNSGPTEVMDNTVERKLDCHNNSTITGGPNVGSLDTRGQCYRVPAP
jgi:hypothetical protein